MTHDTTRASRRAALPAGALAALLLAGCSTGHIGESWQCPLAEGGLCDSVAAADPAVPERRAAGAAVLAEPLWRVRAGEPPMPPAREPALPAREPAPDSIRGPGQAIPAQTSCAAGCDGGFDPFAWLARLFRAEADEGGARPAEGSARASPVPAMQPSDAGPSEEAAARTAEPDPSPFPGEAGASQDGPARDEPHAGDLRTGEIVARIWIAPFVDADGVYREASHVRVVLEPAGWRLR